MLTFLLVLTFPESIICVLYQNGFIEKDESGFLWYLNTQNRVEHVLYVILIKKSLLFYWIKTRDIFVSLHLFTMPRIKKVNN